MLSYLPTHTLMKKLIIFLFCSLSLCIFAGCFASRMSFKNGKDWIPVDFDPKNSILLVEKSYSMTSQEKAMEEYMKKNYPYRFEFVTLSSIKLKSDKYSDTVLYRYALINDSYSLTSSNFSRPSVGVHDFRFYDIINAKDYPSPGRGSPVLDRKSVV